MLAALSYARAQKLSACGPCCSVVALWCGDSRAVLGRRGPDGSCRALPLTRDHKPGDPEEVARIRAAGGRVVRAQDKSGNPIGKSNEPCAGLFGGVGG